MKVSHGCAQQRIAGTRRALGEDADGRRSARAHRAPPAPTRNPPESMGWLVVKGASAHIAAIPRASNQCAQIAGQRRYTGASAPLRECAGFSAVSRQMQCDKQTVCGGKRQRSWLKHKPARPAATLGVLHPKRCDENAGYDASEMPD